jgi:hypothetical protein
MQLHAPDFALPKPMLILVRRRAHPLIPVFTRVCRAQMAGRTATRVKDDMRLGALHRKLQREY